MELWFAKLERDVIVRGVFPSVTDLARKLPRYINAYSKDAQPFRWNYSNFNPHFQFDSDLSTFRRP